MKNARNPASPWHYGFAKDQRGKSESVCCDFFRPLRAVERITFIRALRDEAMPKLESYL